MQNLGPLGFVKTINHMGDDAFLSKIAGVSHDSPEGPSVRELIMWGHTSPFEFGQIVFHVTCPIYVFRHIVRHRVFSFMERSGRYVDFSNAELYFPKDPRPDKAKGRGLPLAELAGKVRDHFDKSKELYKEMRTAGIPRELARTVLPVAAMTEFYMRVDVRNLREFLKLRLHRTAQYETRRVAGAMLAEALQYFPGTFRDLIPLADEADMMFLAAQYDPIEEDR